MAAWTSLLSQAQQPTAWKSPNEMAAESNTLKAQEQQLQRQQADAQKAADELRLQESRRIATMKAAQDAGDDPDKFVQGYLSMTGDQEGALKFQEGFDAHLKSLADRDKVSLETALSRNKRTAGVLEGILAEKNPEKQLFLAGQARAMLENEGISGLPQFSSPEEIATYRNLLGIEGTLADRELKQREIAVKEGGLVAEQGRLAAEQARIAQADAKAEADAAATKREQAGMALSAVNSQATYDQWKQDFPEQARTMAPMYNQLEVKRGLKAFIPVDKQFTEEQGMLTNDYKNFLLSKQQGYKGDFNQWQQDDANRKQPLVNVNVGGKPLPQAAINALDERQQKLDEIVDLEKTMQDDFGGSGANWIGDFENWLGRVGGETLGLATPGQSDWWQAYQAHKNKVRHTLFGGNLTQGEGAEWQKQDITPGMAPDKIRNNLKKQREIEAKQINRLKNVYQKGGFNADQLGEYGDVSVETIPNEARKPDFRFNPSTRQLEPVN